MRGLTEVLMEFASLSLDNIPRHTQLYMPLQKISVPGNDNLADTLKAQNQHTHIHKYASFKLVLIDWA